MTNPLVIYHADCTDGYAAAFAAWLKLGDEAEYRAANYNDPALLLPKSTADSDFNAVYWLNRDIYILDFSLPKQSMEWLFAHAKRVVWLDHHKSAFEMWCGQYEVGMRIHFAPNCIQTPSGRPSNPYRCILDDNKSGALLAWEYFHPGTEVPLLIRHIDDRDRWQFKLNGSKGLHAALASYRPWSFEQWEQYFKVGGIRFNALIDEGLFILRAQDAAVSSMAKQARKCRIPDPAPDEVTVAHYAENWEITYNLARIEVAEATAIRGLACNSPLHQSELGHVLATQSGTFGLVWYLSGDNRAKCSLRSNGDYDVSAIAKAFGGGGHLNAAGFETDIDTLMGWLK